MMTLAQASSYFDRTEVFDPFTGSLLFLGQVEPYEDSKRDAYSAYRRVLSAAPGVTMPAHGCLSLLGETWIVGAGEPDGMQELHRRKFVLSPAPSRLKVSTLTQYLSGQSSQETYASQYWSKDAKQVDTGSSPVQFYDVFMPVEVGPRTVLWNSRGAMLTMSARASASGLQQAYSLRLDHPVETGSVTSQVYSPIAGRLAPTGTVTVRMLRVRWQNLFEYDDPADVKYVNGDLSMVFPAGTSVSSSSVVHVGVDDYQVVSVDQLGGAVVAHARKV